MAQRSSIVVCEVLEVLPPPLALAHVRAADGLVYGLNPKTPGITFYALQPGQWVKCEVTEKFHRVLHAELVS